MSRSLKEEFKRNNTYLLYGLYDIALAEEPLPGDLKVKTMDLTCLCLQINNTVVFFFNHTHIKLIKKFKAETMSTVNWKYTKLFFVSQSIELKTFIEQSNSLNSREKKKERKRETERYRDREKDRVWGRYPVSERLQVQHVEIIFRLYTSWKQSWTAI